VWDSESHGEHSRLEGVERLLATSPEGGHLALLNLDQSIQIWNIDERSIVKAFAGHADKVISGDFSPDGKYLLTTARTGPIKLWSMESGRLILNMDEGDLLLPHAVFTSNRSAVATDIRAWKYRGKQTYHEVLVPLLESPSQTALPSGQ
jgi:WD40 repeat protein